MHAVYNHLVQSLLKFPNEGGRSKHGLTQKHANERKKSNINQGVICAGGS